MDQKIKIRILKHTMLAIAFTVLVLAGIIYILFRPVSLYMFTWFTAFKSIRQAVTVDSYIDLPDIIVYSFPDSLWLLSYIFIIGAIWNFQIKKCVMFLLIMPLFAIFHEFLQLFGLFGTFDFYDLSLYCCATIIGLSIIYYCNILIYKSNYYEK